MKLIGPRELLDRRRFGRRRADELSRLRARFTAVDRSTGSAVRARRVLEAKRALFEALAGVAACGGCARGCPAPRGRFVGGRCCGTETLTVFSPAEVRALALAGRRPPREAAREEGHAGCAFRASDGCTLDASDRPARCVTYVCEELRAELEASGRLEAVQAARRALNDALDELDAAPSR